MTIAPEAVLVAPFSCAALARCAGPASFSFADSTAFTFSMRVFASSFTAALALGSRSVFAFPVAPSRMPRITISSSEGVSANTCRLFATARPTE